MKDVVNAKFVQEMIEVTSNMYRLGWDERNGAMFLTFLMKPK